MREIKCVDNIPDLLRVEGDLFYRIREFSKAKESFKALLETSNTTSDDWYRLAITCMNLKEFEEWVLKGKIIPED